MTARRLQAACPVCERVEHLRPDGTVVQHTAPHPSGRWRVCSGSGAAPAPGAVRAWLDGHEADAAARVTRARDALARAQAELAAAEAEHRDRAAWCARERGKL